jgi:hypothetical protein
LIGVPFATAAALKMNADTAVEVSIEEIYVQTPGPAAGEPVAPA